MHFFGYLYGGNLIGPILAFHHLYVQHEKEMATANLTLPQDRLLRGSKALGQRNAPFET